MKKYGRVILSILMAVGLVLTAAACGGNNSSSGNSAAGTYKLSVDVEKAPDDQKAMVQAMAGMLDVTMELKSNGTVRFDMALNAMGESSSDTVEGTWKQEGNKVTVSGTQLEKTSSSLQTDGEMELRDGKLYFVITDDNGSAIDTDYMFFVKQ